MIPGKNKAKAIHSTFIREVRFRLMEESLPRLKKCLASLNEEEIWFVPNRETNSPGTLCLHLCGNVRQYILSAMGGAADRRKRQEEFDKSRVCSRQELLMQLDQTMLKADQLIQEITEDELLKTFRVQGFEMSGLAILLHVTEHFSYHVGQATYIVKMIKNIDMGYYKGMNLNITGPD